LWNWVADARTLRCDRRRAASNKGKLTSTDGAKYGFGASPYKAVKTSAGRWCREVAPGEHHGSELVGRAWALDCL